MTFDDYYFSLKRLVNGTSDSQLSMGMAYYFIYKMQASQKPKLKDGAY